MANPTGVLPRLVDFNRKGNTPAVRALLTAAVFLLAAAAYLGHTHFAHSLVAPPAGGDALAYDSLGWELAHGRGFAINYQETEFRAPYAAAGIRPAEFDDPDTTGLTTTRPPLMPLVMAGLNRLFGRQFWGVRTVNALAMAGTAAIVVCTVCRLAGPLPALMAALNFVVIDWRTRAYARELLTESLAGLAVALLMLLLCLTVRRGRIWVAAATGALFGGALLIRTMFILWLPLLLLFLFRWQTPHGGRDAGRSWRLPIAFLLASLLVPLPWFIRNIEQTERFMPLGAQGTIELSTAYSDESFRRLGMWFNQQEAGAFDDLPTEGLTSLEREALLADEARRRACSWTLSNPLKALLLPPLRLLQEFRPHGPGELYILAFAALGLLILHGRIEGTVGLAILAAASLAIALTWSTAGRFLVPVLPVLHVAAAIGLWTSLLACTLRRHQSRQLVLFPESSPRSTASPP